MNRRLIIFAGLILMSHLVFCQYDLPFNSSGKIEVAGIEKADSLKKDQIFQRASAWFASIGDKNNKMTILERDSVNGKIMGQFKFIVYSQTGLLTKIQGAVSYTLSVEVKEFKYRFIATDFVYHYYAQNRNYEMVETGKKKMLEEKNASGWQKTWRHCKLATGEKVQGQINGIKMAMIVKKPVPSMAAVDPKKPDW
jgi:hypothetical protein